MGPPPRRKQKELGTSSHNKIQSSHLDSKDLDITAATWPLYPSLQLEQEKKNQSKASKQGKRFLKAGIYDQSWEREREV